MDPQSANLSLSPFIQVHRNIQKFLIITLAHIGRSLNHKIPAEKQEYMHYIKTDRFQMHLGLII